MIPRLRLYFRVLFSLLVVVALIVSDVLPVVAGGAFTLEEGEGRINIYGGFANASNYYDIDGNLRLFDSVQTRFSTTTFGITADYGLTEDVELNFDMPIGIYNLTSKALFPDRSIVAPSYIGLGVTYQITSDKLYTSVGTMVKAPHGFHSGIYDDPEHPTFLSDGYFQWTTMLNVGFKHDDVWVKGSGGYNWRDEEPLDELLYSVEVGLSRVEGTGIFVGASGVVTTGDVTKPLRPFYAGASGDTEERSRRNGGTGRFSPIDRENYFAINAGAFVDITSSISLNGKYVVRLFGANSLVLQGGYLGIGYKF
jgi:hypothetical protein